MLSILIPTYNYSCLRLVEELSSRIDAAQIEAEIIVADDASPDVAIVAENEAINSVAHSRYILLKQNIGIAKIRNFLAAEARYEWLLFLDADTFPVYPDFLPRYIAATAGADVVCGGLSYREGVSTGISPLRYEYGRRYEALPLAVRQRQPYGMFKTSSFLIDSKVFREILFDESFCKYGHEDTLLGKELEVRRFRLTQIDNPVYHDDSDTSERFLAKSRMAIENLCAHTDKLMSHSRLLQFYVKMKRLHCAAVAALIFRWFGRAMERNLLSGKPSMFVFNVYKLSYLCFVMVGRGDSGS